MNSKSRVALLTNFLPVYRVPLLECLAENVRELRVFLSVRMEGNRDWPVFWGRLNVVVNRSITIPRRFRNVHGYTDQTYTHIPYDTLPQLWSYRPDVIVSNELGARTLMARIYKILRPSTKLIIWATLSERTEESRGGVRKILRRLLLRGADAVYVNGASGSRYIRSMGYDGPISVAPYAADNSVFLDPGTRQRCGALRLLYTGQLVERKGLYSFLRHLARWCKVHPARSVVLSVVGSGDQLDLLKQIELPPNLQVDFKGSMRFEQLPSQYHGADLYVYPTLADEWGLVVNEAMIAGLPVLGSRYSQAVDELVQDGINGWLFTPTSEQDTYDAVGRALESNAETLDAMSRRAIETVAGITQQTVAGRMSETICQVFGG
ncbi:glycosyltransferase family 4 protein [Edaphobacter aggregans]|uniref:glycosyltransferase family 4 protein n=1 Tax=Edaphobacter aggregans TaxID=570835 RepID=UPI00054F186E|nr:glycosyltransferase family 4 protein [Edaphobacter aggregans]